MCAALVLKRCISALPEDECPYIPKSYLSEKRPRIYSQLAAQIPGTSSTSRYTSNSNSNKSNNRSPKQEEDQCQEKREIGQEIIIEKMYKTNTLVMRVAENIIFHLSGGTAHAKQV